MSTTSTPQELSFAYYRYHPSLGAAILFVILFVSATAHATFKLVRTKAWFLVPFVLGGFFEWIGYIGRAVSSSQSPNFTAGPYTVQAILLLLGPALFSASTYMLLGRVITAAQGERYSLIPLRWLTTAFVTGDVVCFAVQGVGGGMMSSGKLAEIRHGQTVVIVGLAAQLFFFGIFFINAVWFHWKEHHKCGKINRGARWKKHLHALYVGSLLIMARAIYRIVEYSEGSSGYVVSHEVFLYVLDALFMLVVMLVFAIVHPGHIYKSSQSKEMGLVARGPLCTV